MYYYCKASCSLVEDDPNIPMLFDPDFIDLNTNYTQEFIQRMASNTGPSLPPIFDSFSDPSIKQQLRKNVLLIINKMLSMQDPNMSYVLFNIQRQSTGYKILVFANVVLF